MTSTDRSTAIVAIRPASVDDTVTVARLAALDSAEVPAGRLLMGVVDGCPLAVVSVDTGVAVADPFTPTAELVALVRRRAERLRAADAPGTGRPAVLRRLRRAVGSPAA